MLKIYEIEYASSAKMEEYKRQKYRMTSEVELKVGDGVILKSTSGLVLGRVTKDISENYVDYEDMKLKDSIDKSFYKKVDLSDYYAELETKQKMKDYEKEMESKFAELDKKLKYKFYAENDEDFKKIYDEYIKLGG